MTEAVIVVGRYKDGFVRKIPNLSQHFQKLEFIDPDEFYSYYIQYIRSGLFESVCFYNQKGELIESCSDYRDFED